jgi:hypothetical protein
MGVWETSLMSILAVGTIFGICQYFDSQLNKAIVKAQGELIIQLRNLDQAQQETIAHTRVLVDMLSKNNVEYSTYLNRLLTLINRDVTHLPHREDWLQVLHDMNSMMDGSTKH